VPSLSPLFCASPTLGPSPGTSLSSSTRPKDQPWTLPSLFLHQTQQHHTPLPRTETLQESERERARVRPPPAQSSPLPTLGDSPS
jgi:hypothetical protein